MVPLSDLSIGFIVGGSVIFVSLILGFVVWMIIDRKRLAKPKDVNSHTRQSRVEHGAANVHLSPNCDETEAARNKHVYVDIHLEGDHNRTTANTSRDSDKNEKEHIPTNDSTGDSGYFDSQGFIGQSEVYSRLHEVENHPQNVYGYLTDEDSGQGSYVPANSVSVSSDNDDEHGSSSISVATPTRKRSFIQSDTIIAETTPRNDVVDRDYEMYYPAALPRVEIIELRRSTVCEQADGFNKILDLNINNASNRSSDSDTASVQDTPL